MLEVGERQSVESQGVESKARGIPLERSPTSVEEATHQVAKKRLAEKPANEPRRFAKLFTWFSKTRDEVDASEGASTEPAQSKSRRFAKLIDWCEKAIRDAWEVDGKLDEPEQIDPAEAFPFIPLDDPEIPLSTDEKQVICLVILAMIARIDRIADVKLRKEIEKSVDKRKAVQWLNANVKGMRELARTQKIYSTLGTVGMFIPLGLPKIVPYVLEGRGMFASGFLSKLSMDDPLKRDEMKKQILGMSQQIPTAIQGLGQAAQTDAQPTIEGGRASMDLVNKKVDATSGAANQLKQTLDQVAQLGQSFADLWAKSAPAA